MTLALGAEEKANRTPLLDLPTDKGVDIDAQKSSPQAYRDYGYTALYFSIRCLCSRPYSCLDPTSQDFFG